MSLLRLPTSNKRVESSRDVGYRWTRKNATRRGIVYLIAVILQSMVTAHTRSSMPKPFHIHRYDLWINFNLQSIFYQFFHALFSCSAWTLRSIKKARNEWETHSTANSMRHNLKNFFFLFQILTLLPSFSSSLRYQSTASERLKSIINYKL